ncbi:MAG: nucleotide exchange factor GrpE [Lachnospiraceae bacterium]
MAEQEKELEKDEQEKEPVKDTVKETAETETAPDESAGQAEAAKEQEAGEKPSDRKKKKDKKEEKKEEAYKEKISELEDKVKRQMAEFENFRKRTEKEKNAMYDVGAKSVIEKILPVVDNFERGLASVPEEEKSGAFADGMNMIYKQLIGELDKLGVKPIEAVGKEFDPNLHNAVMQTTSDELESGYVAQELQKGYTYHDSVIRHSMVSVVE